MNKFLLYTFVIFTAYSKISFSNEINIEGLFTNITQLRDSIEQLNEKEEYNDNKTYRFIFTVSSKLKESLKVIQIGRAHV